MNIAANGKINAFCPQHAATVLMKRNHKWSMAASSFRSQREVLKTTKVLETGTSSTVIMLEFNSNCCFTLN